jgi:hypothetical protein
MYKRLPAFTLVATLAFAACGSDTKTNTAATTVAAPATTAVPATTAATSASTAAPAPAKPQAATAASDLRTTLELALQEHVYLAGLATAEALGGRTQNFTAAATALDANSDAITAAIGSVYGDAAGKAFGPLWKKHIGFFVDYTTGLATNDTAKADKALSDLTNYASEFGAFLESATDGGLPKAAVADLVKHHAGSLVDAIKAQKAGDATLAFKNLKIAAGHMTMIAKPLAQAITKQKKLAGDPTSAAAELRVALNRNLQEHVYLAGAATGEALGGRTAGFEGAAAALDMSSDDLTAAIGSVYGDAAGKAFGPLWKKHIGFFVDYTTGLATNDTAKADKGVTDLTNYAAEFGAFLESATAGGLPKAAVADLVTHHATTLIAAIKAQKANDPASFKLLMTAAGHMPMIANPLAQAITTQQKLAA